MKRSFCLIFAIAILIQTNGFAETLNNSEQTEKPSTIQPNIQEIEQRAQKGDADAQTRLGCLYFKGVGVSQDYTQARQWFEKAAVQGDSSAQTFLGYMYWAGKGVPQDYTQAINLYEKAALQEDALAEYDLGQSYLNGWGVPKDYIQSYKWFNLAAAQNPQYGNERDSVEKLMTNEQIAESQQLTREWLKAHPVKPQE